MLFANNLTDLPDRLFHALSSLQVLLLTGNRLHCLRAGLSRGWDQLRLLSLYDNQLRAIAEPALAPLISQSLQAFPPRSRLAFPSPKMPSIPDPAFGQESADLRLQFGVAGQSSPSPPDRNQRRPVPFA